MAKKTEARSENPVYRIQSESREDYLEAIYVFSRMCDGKIRSSELAEYMGFSRASVCRAVAALKSEGLLTMDDSFLLELTETSKQEAVKIYDKHKFFEDLLIRSGVESATARAEACRMEHGISDDSFRKLSRAINNAFQSYQSTAAAENL